jgi:hypothetical protein
LSVSSACGHRCWRARVGRAQLLTDKHDKLQSAAAGREESAQREAVRDATALAELTRERDALQMELNSLQAAGTRDAAELRREVRTAAGFQ